MVTVRALLVITGRWKRSRRRLFEYPVSPLFRQPLTICQVIARKLLQIENPARAGLSNTTTEMKSFCKVSEFWPISVF